MRLFRQNTVSNVNYELSRSFAKCHPLEAMTISRVAELTLAKKLTLMFFFTYFQVNFKSLRPDFHTRAEANE